MISSNDQPEPADAFCLVCDGNGTVGSGTHENEETCNECQGSGFMHAKPERSSEPEDYLERDE